MYVNNTLLSRVNKRSVTLSSPVRSNITVCHAIKIFTGYDDCFVLGGGVRSMRGLGPTMTVRGQSIGISIAMLPQTLIMSRLDQLT